MYGGGTAKLPAEAPAGKLASLDVFRGAVIATMVFVNYLHDIKDIPAWAKHMPYPEDGYTFVDVVFPAFLFIVGVAIPLALDGRRRRGASTPALVAHIVLRSAGLILLGLIMVNEEEHYSAGATGIAKGCYYLAAYAAAGVLFAVYPSRTPAWRAVAVAARVAAALALAYLLAVYRGETKDGEDIWLRPSYWGILGIIGWAYLNCALLYLAVRGDSTALMGLLGFMVALYVGGKAELLDFLGPFNEYVSVGELFGSTSAVVTAGMLVGNTFLPGSPVQGRARLRFMAVFGVGLYLAGTLLRPLHGGIVKNDATESYVLVTAGICCLLFAAFHYLIDVRGLRAGVGFLGVVGTNALLAYLLPDFLGHLLDVTGGTGLLWHADAGWPGAANAAAATVLVLLVAWMLTRLGVRLRL